MGLQIFSRKQFPRRLDEQISFRKGHIRVGKVLCQYLGSEVLLAYNPISRHLAFITPEPEEREFAYPMDRRRRIHCVRALREFGLAHVRGVVRASECSSGRVDFVIPKVMLKKERNDDI